MSRNTKIVLIVVASLAGLCLIACGVAAFSFGLLGQRMARAVDVGEENADTTSQAIAVFTLPERFVPESSIKILGMAAVMYESNQDEFMAMVQLPIQGELTGETMRQLQENLERQTGRTFTDLKTIEERDVTIRGEPATVIVQEGTDRSGETFRQMLVAFQGKRGPAMMMIVAPAANWQQADYDAIVESIQ